MATQSFISDLKTNTYSELDTSSHKLDLQGWMDPQFEHVFKEHIIKYDRPITIVEVGSWKGLSTSTMARICKENNVEATIIAIDTWLGAPEFWTWGLQDETRGESLNRINGYPSVYFTFIKNMKILGHDDMIVPLPLNSVCAFDVLKYYQITADVIYIDAAHEYESVKQDLSLYMKLLNENGMIFGDDYSINWPGVVKAVDELILHKKINGVVWYYINNQ